MFTNLSAMLSDDQRCLATLSPMLGSVQIRSATLSPLLSTALTDAYRRSDTDAYRRSLMLTDAHTTEMPTNADDQRVALTDA